MPERIYCDFCQVELELSRALIYHVEMDDYAGHEEVVAYLEQSPVHHSGEPLRLCKLCYDSVNQNALGIVRK